MGSVAQKVWEMLLGMTLEIHNMSAVFKTFNHVKKSF